MSSINQIQSTYTHEGGKAKQISPEMALRRSVMSCLLWEKTFYENGEDIATRIAQIIPVVSPNIVFALAVEARTKMNLRHAPLLIAREMARHDSHKSLVSKLLNNIIQRADELTEFLAIYWKDKRQPLSAQVKKGLARAFKHFNEYRLGKYNRKKSIKLRDVLRICHPKPDNEEQADLWGRLIRNELKTPDTWEVSLSQQNDEDKKTKWLKLLKENKLGAMALMRNLRNMIAAGIDKSIIKPYLRDIDVRRILPFRFISAAQAVPGLEDVLEECLFKSLQDRDKLLGETIILVDVSGSMTWPLSGRGESSRIDAACGLAMILRELCESVSVYTFSNGVVSVAPRRGMSLSEAIRNSQANMGTQLGAAVFQINKMPHDRIIVITDEQSHDNVPDPVCGKAYMLNVGTCENGVGYYKWTHIDGFSASTIDYIQEIEKDQFPGEERRRIRLTAHWV